MKKVDLQKLSGFLNINLTSKKTYVNPRPMSFRASGLPVCPTYIALEKRKKKRQSELFNFRKDYILSYGTFTHSIVQKWLGLSGILYGKWLCTQTGKIYPKPQYSKTVQQWLDDPNTDPKLKYKKKSDWSGCFGPMISPNGQPMEYVEYQVYHPSGFSGHCDGIILWRNTMYPIDFKTSTKEMIKKYFEEKGIPHNYKEQLNSYCYLLRSPLKMKFKRGLIVFIDRASIDANWTVMQFKSDDEMFENTVKSYKETQSLIKDKKWKQLSNMGICEEKEDAIWCINKAVCFSRKPKEDILSILETGDI